MIASGITQSSLTLNNILNINHLKNIIIVLKKLAI